MRKALSFLEHIQFALVLYLKRLKSVECVLEHFVFGINVTGVTQPPISLTGHLRNPVDCTTKSAASIS